MFKNLAIAFSAAQGNKTFEWLDFVNPYGRHLYQQQAIKIVPPKVAKTVLALSSEHKIPAWAVEHLDMKLIRTSANS